MLPWLLEARRMTRPVLSMLNNGDTPELLGQPGKEGREDGRGGGCAGKDRAHTRRKTHWTTGLHGGPVGPHSPSSPGIS